MYEWRDHTAEIELFVRSDDPEGVFREAADAFGRYVELDSYGERATRSSPRRTALLCSSLCSKS
jgi:hypothetical protein